MQKYELLYIIPSQYAENQIDDIVKRMEALVEKIGGKIFRKENLGKIKLAYPIRQAHHGTYILVYFETEPSTVKELDRQLKMMDEVLRHQLLIMPKEAPERTYAIEAYTPPLSDEGKRQRPGMKRTMDTPLAPPVPRVAEKPLSIEELDKKLDEILKADITENL